MAHTMLFATAYNAPEDRVPPEGHDWANGAAVDSALKTIANVLRPWTIDFHVAQNDGAVNCLPHDPNGKLDIVKHARDIGSARAGSGASHPTEGALSNFPDRSRALRGAIDDRRLNRVSFRFCQHLQGDGYRPRSPRPLET